jgi:predicted transposase YdaD
VAQKIAMITDTEQRQNLASCTEIFAGLRFDQTLIHQFFKEDMMKESVIYQDILKKGKQAEALLLVTRLINRRFGEIEPLLMQTVEALSVEQLESLNEEMLTIITIDQLREWLNSL